MICGHEVSSPISSAQGHNLSCMRPRMPGGSITNSERNRSIAPTGVTECGRGQSRPPLHGLVPAMTPLRMRKQP